MKRKTLLIASAVTLSIFAAHGFASSSVFPSAFEKNKAAQSCSVASDITPDFCPQFQKAVQGCSPLGPLPMQEIYTLMMDEYGTLQNACTANAQQYGGTVEACIGQWTCYFQGGQSQDMSGLCDSDGKRCEAPPVA